MAYLIKTDGTVTEVHPANGTNFSLEELQKFVGGHIELVRNFQRGHIAITDAHSEKVVAEMVLGENSDMWINEEGKLEELAINPIATMLYAYGRQDAIVGDVLIAHTEFKKDNEGETYDIQF